MNIESRGLAIYFFLVFCFCRFSFFSDGVAKDGVAKAQMSWLTLEGPGPGTPMSVPTLPMGTPMIFGRIFDRIFDKFTYGWGYPACTEWNGVERSGTE